MRPVRLLFTVSIVLALAAIAAAKPKRSSFIYMHDADRTTMSGDLNDLDRIKKAFQTNERVLWFRTAGGQEYVVRDPATLNQLDAVWKLAHALAEQQGTLGAKQGGLGAKQGALGSRQGVLGARKGLLGAELAEIAARGEPSTDAEREATTKRTRAIEREMRELDRQMRELDAQMRELDKPMRELEAQMDAIGKKHDVASKQAESDGEALMARSIASGIAKPFKP